MAVTSQDNKFYKLTKHYEPVSPCTNLHKIKPLEHNTPIGSETRVTFRFVLLHMSHIAFRFAYGLLVTENETHPSSFSRPWSPVSMIEVPANSDEIGSLNIKRTPAIRNYSIRETRCFQVQARDNLSEIYISWPTPWFSLSPRYFLLILI